MKLSATFLSERGHQQPQINSIDWEQEIFLMGPVSDQLSLDISGTAGHVEVFGGGDYQWGQAGLALNCAVGGKSSF